MLLLFNLQLGMSGGAVVEAVVAAAVVPNEFTSRKLLKQGRRRMQVFTRRDRFTVGTTFDEFRE